MTNIQAIDLLKGLEQCLDDYCELNDEGKTAFHMAIEALEVFGNSEQLPSAQPETHEERTGTHACDLISRQAAVTIPVMPKEHRHYQTNNLDDAYEQGWNDLQECIENLPPAQPEIIRINLNEPIKVKLTEWGKEIFYHQYDRINEITGREVVKPSLPKEDENGYTEFQLWEFMELYGMHMGMTLPNVIEPLEIVYDARRKERW